MINICPSLALPSSIYAVALPSPTFPRSGQWIYSDPVIIHNPACRFQIEWFVQSMHISSMIEMYVGSKEMNHCKCESLIRRWMIDNCLMIVWWLFDDCVMDVWWMFDDFLMIVWWLLDDCLMIVRWLFDDCLIIVWWLLDECLMIFGWLFNDCLTIVWWLVDDCLTNCCFYLILTDILILTCFIFILFLF